MLEYYTSTNTFIGVNFIPMLLRDLNDLLIQNGKTTKDFDMPTLSSNALEFTIKNYTRRVINIDT